jgi:hypothetical protein
VQGQARVRVVEVRHPVDEAGLGHSAAEDHDFALLPRRLAQQAIEKGIGFGAVQERAPVAQDAAAREPRHVGAHHRVSRWKW